MSTLAHQQLNITKARDKISLYVCNVFGSGTSKSTLGRNVVNWQCVLLCSVERCFVVQISANNIDNDYVKI